MAYKMLIMNHIVPLLVLRGLLRYVNVAIIIIGPDTIVYFIFRLFKDTDRIKYILVKIVERCLVCRSFIDPTSIMYH